MKKYKLSIIALFTLGQVSVLYAQETSDKEKELKEKKIEEVVLVGYGTQKKSEVTGAVSSVKIGEIKNIPLARTDEALQGQVAGVHINNNDASPNADVSIRIRGVSSLSGGNDPLIIVDGVQGASIKNVHPDDIKSIEVLKDASSTSIYGSRGANGVILITTNSGRKNSKPYVSFSSYTSYQTVRKMLDLMSPLEYAKYTNENRVARSLLAPFTPDQIAEFKAGAGTDWQNEIYRTGISSNYHLNVSGGTENMTYSISGDYLETTGIVIGSKYRKYSVRPNFTVDLAKNLKLSLYSEMNFSKDNPTILNQRERRGSPVNASFQFAPTKPIYNPDGTYSQPGGNVGSNTEYNPVALALEPIRDFYSNNIVVSPTLEYTILKGLTASVSGSYQLYDDENNSYFNEKIVNGISKDRVATIMNSKYTSFQNTNMLTYDKKFGENHSLKLTGVYEQQKAKFFSIYNEASDFLTNSFTYHNLQSAKSISVPQTYSYEWSMESYLGRLNYSYAGKYLLTVSGRLDKSSVFAENNKSAFFPSAAIGWNVKKENFLADSKTINDLRLRGSYGAVGNAAIRPYQSLAKLVTGTFYSFDGNTLVSGIGLDTQAPNPDLKWETTKQLNVGFDLSMFNSRLSLTADYYKKKTTDLLLQQKLFEASGYKTKLVNAGEVDNTGIEVLLSGTPIKTEDFKWNSSFTFSKNDNKVVALNSGDKNLSVGAAGVPQFDNILFLEVGQPIGLIKGFEYAGVWKSAEAAEAQRYGAKPGDEKYADQNNDGKIDNEDIVNIANTLPKYNFSWNNTFSYKNFDLNVFVIAVQGNDVYNLARSLYELSDLGTGRALLNTWTPSNENTNIPGHNATTSYRNSSRWVEDGSYIRIKNITLGYNFKSNLLNNLGITSARIYLTGTNLFTFTKYTGYDPEANNAKDISRDYSSDAFSGLDLASYPSQKKYTIGININF